MMNLYYLRCNGCMTNQFALSLNKGATTFGISSGVALIILAGTHEISDGFDFQNMNLNFN